MSKHYLAAKLQLSGVKILSKLISIPRPLVFMGADSALQLCNNIHQLGVKHVLIVTDEILLSLGLITAIEDALLDRQVKVSIFSGVKPDPTLQLVEQGLALLKQKQCDGVLAIGGGSAIDTAKVIALAGANHKAPQKLVGMLKARKPALALFAIPTTSGTGSEVTIGAVVSDTKTHQKSLVIDPKLVPLATALDPKITQGMPPAITADTGLDALTHALEAWVSSFANTESDYYAQAAIKLIFDYLPAAYTDGKNLAAREAMALASHYAGLAINHTGVGYVHAFAHQLGAKYQIPHGRANAVILPHVFAFHRDKCEKRLAQLAKNLNLVAVSVSQVQAADAVLQAVERLMKTLKIEQQVKELQTADYGTIVKAALKEAHGMYSIPKYMEEADAYKVLQALA